MIAYVHGHSIGLHGEKQSFFTNTVEVKAKPLDWQKQGLQFTATGYGSRIPTEYMVKFHDKWRRVYCAIFSNSGTLYIGKRSENLTVQIQK